MKKEDRFYEEPVPDPIEDDDDPEFNPTSPDPDKPA